MFKSVLIVKFSNGEMRLVLKRILLMCVFQRLMEYQNQSVKIYSLVNANKLLTEESTTAFMSKKN